MSSKMEEINYQGAEGGREKFFSVRRMCILALCIALNVVGGQIALLLHLPIYLDSAGTILIAVLYGPLYGMFPPLLYGLVMGFTIDIYSLYYMPAGIILGIATGLVFRRLPLRGWRLLLGALLITIPATIVSSAITAVLFGGITSSGSTVLVQLLHGAGLGLTASVFLVQILTDFADRLLSLALAACLIRRIPAELLFGGKRA